MSAQDHLVHGMGTALEAPTWPAITAAEAGAILARFPAAGAMTALRWHSPRPFSAAALVETDGGEFLLKRHHRQVRTVAALAQEHAFMTHLRGAGLSVPEVLLTDTGSGATALGDWTYELHRSAPGIDLYRDRLSWTPFLSHRHAHEAGAALARLHLAARDFDAPPRGDHPLVASLTILPAPDPLAAAQAYVAARPALAAFLAGEPWLEELSRLFAALGEGLPPQLARQPALWTHGDWHPSNLLWSAEGTVVTTFDFGLAARTCALHDLATAIERTAIPWLEPDHAPADAQAALALLAGYDTVLPLSRDDVETTIALLPLVHIEFALSEVDYFAGILADPEQAALAWKDYLIDHADWFLFPAGQDFLAQVGNGALVMNEERP
ncbi:MULTISPECIES: phosphotransferase enzyme family protein [unclassified Novosphingobium]|uniref:phosphotransferase enzyme family protein n=1 Tax=unclassified Novosphingobium TaxID=2644732 RepID=UPI00135B6AF2|nr:MULTISPECIES: aminoglycoside phosphotransferase family protein [unclassified Novosphingobium]